MVSDTIAAIVTAMGAASVGIVRISGPDSLKIGEKIYNGRKVFLDSPSHSILYGKVYDKWSKKNIDEALFLIMKCPSSFTGEDVVEIQCHGGIVAVKKVLELVLRNGARLAEPGEFSKRAFLNGKLDLAQAESIIDIINAKTEKSLTVALKQKEGNLSKLINNIRQEILSLIAYIEADIDFPEDDIDRLTAEELNEKIKLLKEEIETILKTAQKGKIIREGLNVVIIGKPNVGKSSLLNALLKESRAIVTDIPGTTRDSIEEFLNLGGIPVKIIDTAGIRNTENVVEKIGVDKAKEFMTKAHLVLYVFDVLSGISDQDKEIILNLPESKPVLYLLNKIDIPYPQENITEINKFIEGKKIINISAKENKGLEELEEKIMDMFFAGDIDITQDAIVTNTRHVQALQKAMDYLNGAVISLENNMPGDFIVIDIKGAWESLGTITGDIIEEDILDQIFSQFCIGK